jgi:hypothetical protein
MTKSKNKQQLFSFKNKKNFTKVNGFFWSFLFVFLSVFFTCKIVFAQTVPPSSGDVKVTASIPDIIPPSTPILISPEDGANVDTAYPVFQWYESTDNKAMSHYQFILDGTVWFDNIPLISAANENYSLLYDTGSGIYTLVASTPLDHGSHRWQIVAYDYGENRAASTTWTFNVFVNDPSFEIQKIGDVSVRISATDSSSVPEEPISLFLTDPFGNEPWVIALGDPNLQVNLTVTIPDSSEQFYSQYTDDDGDWSLQLGILPRDQAVRLDFTIVDAVGHTSYIRELYIIIYQHYWPPSSTPTTAPITSLTPTIAFPTASISPTYMPTVSISTTPTVTPTPPLPSPGIEVPIIPVKEIVHEIVEEVKKTLPEKIATLITKFTRSSLWKAFADFSALSLALLLPLVTYILVLIKFYQSLSFKVLREVLLALWPWSRRRKNLVFEYRNSQAAPLVKIELLDTKSKKILDWQITNYLGQFFSFNWPSDHSVMLRVVDHNFYFPIGVDKPIYLSWYNFYQGEAFVCRKDKLDEQVVNFDEKRALAVPTLIAQGKESLPFLERIRIILSYLITYPWWFWFLSLLLILPFVLRHPSFFNYLALVYYLAIALFKYFYTSGTNTWQFRALYSNAHKINHNLILIINDLAQGFSQALVVVMNESLSPKLNLVKKDFIFSLQAKDYALWDGQRVISELEYSLSQETNSEFKLHPIGDAKQSLNNLQPYCQLLPRR